jgi:hypothetical protein
LTSEAASVVASSAARLQGGGVEPLKSAAQSPAIRKPSGISRGLSRAHLQQIVLKNARLL